MTADYYNYKVNTQIIPKEYLRNEGKSFYLTGEYYILEKNRLT